MGRMVEDTGVVETSWIGFSSVDTSPANGDAEDDGSNVFMLAVGS